MSLHETEPAGCYIIIVFFGTFKNFFALKISLINLGIVRCLQMFLFFEDSCSAFAFPFVFVHAQPLLCQSSALFCQTGAGSDDEEGERSDQSITGPSRLHNHLSRPASFKPANFIQPARISHHPSCGI